MTEEHDCCHDTHLDNDAVRTTAAEVERFSRHARMIEVALIGVAATAFTVIAVVGGVTLSRVAGIAEDTKALVEERQQEARRNAAEEEQRDAAAKADDERRRAAQEASDRLAGDAVMCIVGELRAHRAADKTIHDKLLAALRTSAPLPPDIGDIEPPTIAYREACDRFESVVQNGGHP